MSRPTRAWAWVPRMLDIFLRALPHAVPGRRGAKMTKTWRPIPPQHPTTPCHNDWAASRLQSARPSWTRTDDSSTKAPPQGQRERGSAGRAPPRRGPSGSCHFGERQAQCDQLSSPSQQAHHGHGRTTLTLRRPLKASENEAPPGEHHPVAALLAAATLERGKRSAIN